MPRPSLPIDPLLPDVLACLRSGPSLVLEAPPGAGKTTRVPWALVEGGLAEEGEVLVLQPRRLATRLACEQVARELGEAPGGRVGYQVRFEEVASARTRLRFVTEGLLARRLLADPELRGVAAVVLDEFHERHLPGDVGLALLRRLQRERRPELRLVVMSATLDAGPVAEFLGGCPRLRSEGRRFEVAVEHAPLPDGRPLPAQVRDAVRRLVDGGLEGDVLVFLPGAAEIRRCAEALAPLADRASLRVLPLHGDLPATETARAVGPSDRRKVILSTNVAETSVTIDGVVAVVDSGLARIPSHDPWTGLPTLRVRKVSRASAAQRAGRAGRTRPGLCVRLFTRHDHDTRPEFDAPEVRRADLAQEALQLHAAGIADLAAFEWYEAPPAAALAAADRLLQRLGAVTGDGALTPTGRAMLRHPLHPRLARLLVEGEARGIGGEAAAVAALLGERDVRADRGRTAAVLRGESDVLELAGLFEQAAAAGFAEARCRSLGLDPDAARGAMRVVRQLRRPAASGRPPSSGPADPGERDRALLQAILAAYPDRVARRRAAGGERKGEVDLLLAGGGSARLAESSCVRDAPLVVAVDAEERQGVPLVRLASAIEADWLIDLPGEALREEAEIAWNATSERVERVERLVYDRLVIDESRRPAPRDDPRTTRALESAALALDPRSLCDGEAHDRLLARIAFVREAAPDAGLPPLDDDARRTVLASLCRGRGSLEELRRADLPGAWIQHLGPGARPKLDRLAPEAVQLPGGRRAPVHYSPGRTPWVESRLQDFFGMADGPAIGPGRVPLVLHLLAPNHRAVQVTTDLAGFWKRHYPGIRSELRRRYPRHSWPEDPLNAEPPAARR
ncbi:ATP-dependent helicase HrpB [Myxococcota bacterium]|nr:ATP-dependent helicase HrpB [Myxococcota bacterium]